MGIDRAGEEARVDGIKAGADDYLVKPFAARELLARVETHLELARVRAEAAARERAARQEAEALAARNAALLAQAQEHTRALARLNASLHELAEARDRARAEADAARQHLHDLFMQAPAIICVLRGPEHVYELANAPYLQTIGRRQADEVLGQRVRDVLPELETQEYLGLLDRVYQTGEPVVGTERSVLLDRRGDGTLEEVFYTFVYQPSRDTAGQVEGILVHAVDVTQQVRAREVLRESEERFRSLAETAHEGIWLVDREARTVFANARLAEMLGTRPDALAGRRVPEFCFRRADGTPLQVLACTSPVRNAAGEVVGALGMFSDITDRWRAEEERQRLEREKDAFLAAASHDLKNPLAAIKGIAQLLQRRAASGAALDPTRLRAGLASIDAAASDMAAQIDALVDVTRLRMGRGLELERAPTDLVALARRVAAEQQATTERHAIAVETTEATLVGSWDARRLERVLANLLGNAIKYSPEGGPITITLGREGVQAVLAVSDRGVGIPPEDLPRVFEPFHRAANVAGSIPGTGIGLAGVRQIVDQHGGTVAVHSREAEGSTFVVRLPLEPETLAAAGVGG